MKEKFWITGSQIVLLGLALMLASCAPTVTSAQTVPSTKAASAAPALAQPTPQAKNPGTAPDAGGAKMTMEQTLSDQAQLTTIAFDGGQVFAPGHRTPLRFSTSCTRTEMALLSVLESPAGINSTALVRSRALAEAANRKTSQSMNPQRPTPARRDRTGWEPSFTSPSRRATWRWWRR